ncbi:MAG: RNA polymerase sigma factor [Patescibacteria group bacterium]
MKEYFKKKRFLAEINRGDNDAFLQAYDYYAPKIFRHVYYRLHSKETAQDIAQQVFFKTWQFIVDSEKEIENLNGFLYKTANNLIIDYSRKAERKDIPLDDNLGNKISVEPSYISEAHHRLEISRVREALNRLEPEEKKLIIWRYFDDLSIAEISKITGQSKNAVYVAIHRAKKNLKKII